MMEAAANGNPNLEDVLKAAGATIVDVIKAPALSDVEKAEMQSFARRLNVAKLTLADADMLVARAEGARHAARQQLANVQSALEARLVEIQAGLKLPPGDWVIDPTTGELRLKA